MTVTASIVRRDGGGSRALPVDRTEIETERILNGTAVSTVTVTGRCCADGPFPVVPWTDELRIDVDGRTWSRHPIIGGSDDGETVTFTAADRSAWLGERVNDVDRVFTGRLSTLLGSIIGGADKDDPIRLRLSILGDLTTTVTRSFLAQDLRLYSELFTDLVDGFALWTVRGTSLIVMAYGTTIGPALTIDATDLVDTPAVAFDATDLVTDAYVRGAEESVLGRATRRGPYGRHDRVAERKEIIDSASAARVAMGLVAASSRVVPTVDPAETLTLAGCPIDLDDWVPGRVVRVPTKCGLVAGQQILERVALTASGTATEVTFSTRAPVPRT